MTSPTEAEVADLAKLIEAAFEDDQTVNEAGDKFYEIGIARHILAAGYRLPGPAIDAEIYEVIKELQMTEWLPLDPKYPAVLKDAVRAALEAARKVR